MLVGYSDEYLKGGRSPLRRELLKQLQGEMPMQLREQELSASLGHQTRKEFTPNETRGEDFTPYSGGERLQHCEHVSGGLCRYTYCSSGFDVEGADNPSYHAMTTAFHCSDGAAHALWYNDSGSTVGYSNANRASERWDSQLLAGGDGDYSDNIWDGPWDEGSYFRAVVGHSPPIIKGMILCVDGAYSGGICNTKVINSNFKYRIMLEDLDGSNDHQSIWMGPGYVVNRSDGAIIAGKGDSGSPVYQQRPNDHDWDALAAGEVSAIFTGGSNEGDCRGYRDTWRECSKKVIIERWGHVSSSLNVSLKLN